MKAQLRLLSTETEKTVFSTSHTLPLVREVPHMKRLLRRLSCSSKFCVRKIFIPANPCFLAPKKNKFSRCLILEARKQIKNPSIILANACISLKCLGTLAFIRSKKCVQHTDCFPHVDLCVTLGTLHTPSNLIWSH